MGRPRRQRRTRATTTEEAEIPTEPIRDPQHDPNVRERLIEAGILTPADALPPSDLRRCVEPVLAIDAAGQDSAARDLARRASAETIAHLPPRMAARVRRWWARGVRQRSGVGISPTAATRQFLGIEED